MSVAADEESPLLGGGESTTPRGGNQAGRAGLDNSKPPTTSPNGVRWEAPSAFQLQQQQQQQPAKYLLRENFQQQVQPADSNSRLCCAIGSLAVLSWCSVLVAAVYVLLFKPEDRGALQAFMGKNWPLVLSLLVFSPFTAVLLWKMESMFGRTGQMIDQRFDRIFQTFGRTGQKLDQRFDRIFQKLDEISSMVERHIEENKQFGHVGSASAIV